MVERILVPNRVAGGWDHIAIGTASGAFVRLMPAGQARLVDTGPPIEIEGTRLEIIFALRMGLADQYRAVCSSLADGGVILMPTAQEWATVSELMRMRVTPAPWGPGDAMRIDDGTGMRDTARCDVAVMVGGRWTIIVTDPVGCWGGMLCEQDPVPSTEVKAMGGTWWAGEDGYRLCTDEGGRYLKLIEAIPETEWR